MVIPTHALNRPNIGIVQFQFKNSQIIRFSPNNLQPMAARACIPTPSLGPKESDIPLIPWLVDDSELQTDTHWYLFVSLQSSATRPRSGVLWLPIWRLSGETLGLVQQKRGHFNLSPGPKNRNQRPFSPSASQAASSRVQCCEVPWCSKTWRASPCLCT